MQAVHVDTSSLPVRKDLQAALDQAWSELPVCGAWLNGAQRMAVAREARQAWECKLCQRRKEALSPYAIEGTHDQISELPEVWAEVIHRVVTDSGRITESWYDSIIGQGVLEDEFIEILGLATIVTCVDTFMRGAGLSAPALPGGPVSADSPARTRPGGAKAGPGWAFTVAPEDAGPELGDFYVTGPQYIRRALTLVPDELNRFWHLMNALYMDNPAVNELEGYERAISRAQIELIATRVSAYLDCFY